MGKSVPPELVPLAPFDHDIDLGDKYNTSLNSYRIRNATGMFFPPLLKLCGGTLRNKTVLDLACNCGGFSFVANRFGAKKIIGIDSSERNIIQANACKEYLGIKNIDFIQGKIENLHDYLDRIFDVVLCMGILYHLKDPIGVIEEISKFSKEIIVVDSHVHYSTQNEKEDMPSWWMLADTDKHDYEGLYEGDNRLSKETYKKFEDENPIDYSFLPDGFVGSPHTQRDIKYSRLINNTDPVDIKRDSVCRNEIGAPVMVPNKKAILKLLRWAGFEDVLEILPHRFSEEPYLRHHRVGLIGIKRNMSGAFAKPIGGYDKA